MEGVDIGVGIKGVVLDGNNATEEGVAVEEKVGTVVIGEVKG